MRTAKLSHHCTNTFMEELKQCFFFCLRFFGSNPWRRDLAIISGLNIPHWSASLHAVMGKPARAILPMACFIVSWLNHTYCSALCDCNFLCYSLIKAILYKQQGDWDLRLGNFFAAGMWHHVSTATRGNFLTDHSLQQVLDGTPAIVRRPPASMISQLHNFDS